MPGARVVLTRHHALGAALGLVLGLLVALMANGLMAGAAAVATGEIVLR
ncbi:hypothetical protein [Pelagerythrobacter marinus]|nr:hypothetical protein [Pelagerythrobacter marinus]WPZ05625.1 hypothetical protein T8T98_09300 [Pelagerythrobacter marinus]